MSCIRSLCVRFVRYFVNSFLLSFFSSSVEWLVLALLMSVVIYLFVSFVRVSVRPLCLSCLFLYIGRSVSLGMSVLSYGFGISFCRYFVIYRGGFLFMSPVNSLVRHVLFIPRCRYFIISLFRIANSLFMLLVLSLVRSLFVSYICSSFVIYVFHTLCISLVSLCLSLGSFSRHSVFR